MIWRKLFLHTFAVDLQFMMIITAKLAPSHTQANINILIFCEYASTKFVYSTQDLLS